MATKLPKTTDENQRIHWMRNTVETLKYCPTEICFVLNCPSLFNFKKYSGPEEEDIKNTNKKEFSLIDANLLPVLAKYSTLPMAMHA